MRSNEAREKMVERVQAAAEKWPSLSDMPEVPGDKSFPLDPNLYAVDPSQAYVKALYGAAYQGEPVGRVGMSISSKKVEEPADLVARPRGKTLKAGG